MSRTRKRLFSILASILAAIALLETVPRFVEIPGLTYGELDPLGLEFAKSRIEPHPYLAYVPKANFRNAPHSPRQISHNSLGFRGPEIAEEKPKGVLRILCLGGSSTYGHFPSRNETTWPYRLQERLGEERPDLEFEVINGGCQGYTSFESLGNLAFRGLPLEPDIVIVYHAINDMRGALYDEVKTDNTHRRAVIQLYRETWFDKSWTFLTLRAYLTDYVASKRDLGSYVIVDYDERKNNDKFRWTNDRGFDNFERNLNSIVSLANGNGATVVLGTQAIKESTLNGTRSKAEQLRGFQHANSIVRRVAEQRKQVLCDLGPKLTEEGIRRVAEGGQELFVSDVHVSDAGADRIAEEFANTILAASLLPGDSSRR